MFAFGSMNHLLVFFYLPIHVFSLYLLIFIIQVILVDVSFYTVSFSTGVRESNGDGGRGYGWYGGFEGGRGYGGRDRGRGRVRGYHGRGRGYGGGSMQQEWSSYTVCNDYVGGAPSAQGHGKL